MLGIIIIVIWNILLSIVIVWLVAIWAFLGGINLLKMDSVALAIHELVIEVQLARMQLGRATAGAPSVTGLPLDRHVL